MELFHYSHIVAMAAGITGACMWWDMACFRIPNRLVAALLAAYPAALWLAPQPMLWWWSVLIALVALGLGMGLFAIRALGGGDVKLLAVALLWVDPRAALPYLGMVALLGGGLTMGVVLLRALLMVLPNERLPRVLRHKEPLPYGVAIGGALLLHLWAVMPAA